ncbi:DUF3616 domain-containing protein [Pararhizobium haloflavum]|uniref:DUF3616 domain-containing protein n=1 Tax=Pararhizobium haloflavum TaxID=2037914 RepID=UPI0012FFDC33|nr:DUF3616 domain-containing protein [Pararhizobium haloflavum]
MSRRQTNRRTKHEKDISVDFVGQHPQSRLRLTFLDKSELRLVDAVITEDISALATIGRTLFCACDETATVERLVFDEATNTFAGHENFAIGHAFDLPGGLTGEMDIEGLAIDDGYLWITGSHGLKRKHPNAEDGTQNGLSHIDWDENRGFLGRVPIVESEPGVFMPVASIEALEDGSNARRAAMFAMGKSGEKAIRKVLADDPLLAPFMNIPCKENGFDVEGLAVKGDRLHLGLRGPVLGSHALIVTMRFKDDGKGRLKHRKLDGGSRYTIHALDLDGLGIRDLLFDGEALLVLAGATQNIDGIQKIYTIDRFPERADVITAGEIETMMALPIMEGCDHAEGLSFFEMDGKRHLLVAYDSPSDDRHDPKSNRLDVDVYELK